MKAKRCFYRNGDYEEGILDSSAPENIYVRNQNIISSMIYTLTAFLTLCVFPNSRSVPY